MQTTDHIIKSVVPDSIADEMGLEPGDALLSVNGQPVRDVFDYHFLCEDYEITVLIRKPDGEEWELDIEKEPGEELGITFENSLMDDYRSCCNRCIFCFIDQMPPGMRDTLYFKDDDSRLSFLNGNYITMTNMKQKDIERIVRPCGLGKSKARDISLCMKALRDNFCGRVPDNMEDLLSLPGVGRKSANLIMGDIYKKPAIVCDTHCIRLTNRIGLVHDTKDPKKVEMELWKIIPPEESNDFCHRLVDHGRAVCQARTAPDCAHCVLKDICERNI